MINLLWKYFCFSAARFQNYPLEVLVILLRRIAELSLLALFWWVINQSSGQSLGLNFILSYFLIANFVTASNLILRSPFAKTLMDTVKHGRLSNYLIKPLNPIPVLYVYNFGGTLPDYLFSIAGLLFGLYLLPNLTWIGAGLFLILLGLSVLLGVAYGLFLGTLSLYTKEANSFRHVSIHIIKLLSGAMIPLYMFPEAGKRFVELTPFPAMIYGPIRVLQSGVWSPEIAQIFLVSVIWTVILLPLAYWVWRRGLKAYDAIGL